ncbi:phenylalanine 4-monooxygenase [soil metagenome]
MKQEYNNYTNGDHKVWSLLFNRQMDTLSKHAAIEFVTGVNDVQFTAALIPDFIEVNELLKKQTGWQIQAVPGIMPNKEFFELLATRHFPATTWIRKPEQLDYLEEPDMFHDVFGHVPLLSNQHFCDFLTGLSEIALAHIDNADIIELIGRVYWFTVEFGLITQNDDTKIYGAGLASSIGETKFSLQPSTPKHAFDVQAIIDSPYRNDVFQEKYFKINSLDELNMSLPTLKRILETIRIQPSPHEITVKESL